MKYLLYIIPLFTAVLIFGAPEKAHADRLWSFGAELQSAASFGEVDTVVGSTSAVAIAARSGEVGMWFDPQTQAMRIQHRITGATSNALYGRAYLKITDTTPSQEEIAGFCATGGGTNITGTGMNILIDTDSTLTLWSASTTPAQIGSASTALITDQWYRIEWYINPSDTSWEVEAKIDGTTFASGNIESLGAGTNWDMTVGRASNTAGCTTTGNQGSFDMYVDDVAVNDDQGSSQNSWPGEGKIVHMQPNAAGDNDQATSSPDSWLDVDEVVPDGAGTIAWFDADTGGDILDVNLESAASAGIDSYDKITLVQVGSSMRGVNNSNFVFNLRLKSRSNGTLINGSSITFGNTVFRTHDDSVPRIHSLTSYTDPQNGGDWTPSLLNNSQIGVNCTDCAPDMGLSNLWALIEYVDGSAPSPVVAPRFHFPKGKFILSKGRIILR